MITIQRIAKKKSKQMTTQTNKQFFKLPCKQKQTNDLEKNNKQMTFQTNKQTNDLPNKETNDLLNKQTNDLPNI